MKPYHLSGLISPLYVLCAGMLGLVIPFVMYRWDFPYSHNVAGEKFVGTQSFALWVSFIAILFSVTSIVLFPAWTVFIRIFRFIYKQDQKRLPNIIITLTIASLLFLTVILAAFYWPTIFSYASNTQLPNILHPGIIGLTERFIVVYSYPSLAIWPVLIGILLLNQVAEIMSKQIGSLIKNETKVFYFIEEYLGYRSLLQNYLTTGGMLFSIIPLMASAYFSIYVDTKDLSSDQFPLKSIIMYGLILSMVLFLVYIPAYINLVNTGKALRNALYPFDSMKNLEIIIADRDRLDTLLETNVSVGQSMKASVGILAPLASSLVVSLLGVKL